MRAPSGGAPTRRRGRDRGPTPGRRRTVELIGRDDDVARRRGPRAGGAGWSPCSGRAASARRSWPVGAAAADRGPQRRGPGGGGAGAGARRGRRRRRGRHPARRADPAGPLGARSRSSSCWRPARCCSCSTTASTCSTPSPRSSSGCCRVCPAVEVLATSREPLGLPQETVYQVPTLPVADAGCRPRRPSRRRRPWRCSCSGPPPPTRHRPPTRRPIARRGRAVPAAGRRAAGDRAGRGADPRALPRPRSPNGSATASACWPAPAGSPTSATARCARSSTGRTSCSNPRRSSCSGACRPSPARSTSTPPSSVCGYGDVPRSSVATVLASLVDKSMVQASAGAPHRPTGCSRPCASTAPRWPRPEAPELARRHGAWVVEVCERGAVGPARRRRAALARRVRAALRRPAAGRAQRPRRR